MSSHMSSGVRVEDALDLGSDKAALEQRIELVWEDMRLIPTTPPSAEHDKGYPGNSEDDDDGDADDFATVSVEMDEAEPADIIVDCPLWRDLPDGLMDNLLASARDAINHFELLNKVLDDLFTCKIPPRIADESNAHRIVATAADTLRRLPGCSTQLFDDTDLSYPSDDDQAATQEGYLVSMPPSPSQGQDHHSTRGWASYKVTTRFDTNTIRLALLVAYLDQTTHPAASNAMQGYVNLLSRLLESLSKSHQSFDFETSSSHRPAAYRITMAFLWTAWQRSLLLFSYYVFGTRLLQQVNARFLNSRPFQDTPVDPDIDFSALGTSLQSDAQGARPGCGYVCRYSFELLRSSALSGTQDYRTLFSRFNELFAARDARCRQASNGTWTPCDGKSWKTCGRFFGLEIPDQSAHDISCKRNTCSQLPWDEESYRGVQGPRSISLSSTPKGGPLRYRTASDRTLAVSHVWSHGQGGNPDQGFNECLHDRYAAIARRLGCDSYWIDAACIPSDAQLRSAAIKTINPIFRNSRATLICDKDIMQVDVVVADDTPSSVARLEVLISVLLLSDWNVRGWTMLEVVRGSRAVHLLCKDNRPVPLRDVLALLYKNGSIDLCALLIGSPQLMPPGSKLRAPGIETASVMLSRRYASRPGDDVIIWSLLCGDDQPHQSPTALWKSRQGGWVKTGFLMSSCDRIADAPRGYGWAPATPQVLGPYTSSRAPDAPLFWPYDGSGTNAARIMTLGTDKATTTTCLRGKWLAHVYSPSDEPLVDHSTGLSCWQRAEQLFSLEGYARVLFLRPLFVESVESGWTPELSAPFTAAQNQDEGELVAVAVCATNEDHAQYVDIAYPEEYTGLYELEPECWEWKGVCWCTSAEVASRLRFKTRQVRIV
ncbi:hypothetical protein MKX07_004234 [Trichoderma sp. CBMAI-0711]|nr:hypothetical protein MKX07_004234 [Trichoderma sp. CBMAI-0711]